MDDIYKNTEECNQDKKRSILIVFDDTIADILSNKKLNSIVTALDFRGRKLFIIFMELEYFSCFYYTILFCCTKKY